MRARAGGRRAAKNRSGMHLAEGKVPEVDIEASQHLHLSDSPRSTRLCGPDAAGASDGVAVRLTVGPAAGGRLAQGEIGRRAGHCGRADDQGPRYSSESIVQSSLAPAAEAGGFRAGFESGVDPAGQRIGAQGLDSAGVFNGGTHSIKLFRNLHDICMHLARRIDLLEQSLRAGAGGGQEEGEEEQIAADAAVGAEAGVTAVAADGEGGVREVRKAVAHASRGAGAREDGCATVTDEPAWLQEAGVVLMGRQALVGAASRDAAQVMMGSGGEEERVRGEDRRGRRREKGKKGAGSGGVEAKEAEGEIEASEERGAGSDGARLWVGQDGRLQEERHERRFASLREEEEWLQGARRRADAALQARRARLAREEAAARRLQAAWRRRCLAEWVVARGRAARAARLRRLQKARTVALRGLAQQREAEVVMAVAAAKLRELADRHEQTAAMFSGSDERRRARRERNRKKKAARKEAAREASEERRGAEQLELFQQWAGRRLDAALEVAELERGRQLAAVRLQAGCRRWLLVRRLSAAERVEDMRAWAAIDLWQRYGLTPGGVEQRLQARQRSWAVRAARAASIEDG